jgi:hypothetical protein
MTAPVEGKQPWPPDFLITGAQKAGTTALYTYLSKHPSISATEKKEIHFFNCDNNYSNGEQYYRSLFPKTVAPQVSFDASPGYLEDKQSPGRIFRYNPAIKIIILLRNPIDRAYSAWQMYKQRYEKNRDWFYNDWVSFCGCKEINYKRRNDNSIFDFHAFVEEEILALKYNHVLESPVVTHGHYAEQIRRYFALFDRKQILIIQNNALRLQTKDTLTKIQEFIGVPHFDFEQTSLSPVFEGGYQTQMEDLTRLLLEEYYLPYNEQLFCLLGVRYNW